MNKERTKRLEDINEKLHKMREELDNVRSDEDEAYENMPVALQQSEQGYQMCNNISTLEDVVRTLEVIFLLLEEIINS